MSRSLRTRGNAIGVDRTVIDAKMSIASTARIRSTGTSTNNRAVDRIADFKAAVARSWNWVMAVARRARGIACGSGTAIAVGPIRSSLGWPARASKLTPFRTQSLSSVAIGPSGAEA